jgi:hypothetical protein
MLQHLDVVLKHRLRLFFREILHDFKGHFVVVALVVLVIGFTGYIFNEGYSWVFSVSIYVDLSHFDIVWHLELLISNFILALNHFDSIGGNVGLFLWELLHDGQSGFRMICWIFDCLAVY